MSKRLRDILTLLVAGGLGVILVGCSVLPKAKPPPQQHDLGPRSGATLPDDGLPAGGTFEGVEAPPWLATDEIYYRFLHRGPTQLRVYAQNRWVGTPQALLEDRVRQALSALPEGTEGAPGKTRYRWRLVLESFEQRFDGPDKARAVVRVRVVADTDEPRRLERSFVIELPAEPTVDGAVRGLGLATDRAIVRVAGWLQDELQAEPGTREASGPLAGPPPGK